MTIPDARIETFGSATSHNCMSKHLVEMAEKRALSRAVLKLTNLYEHGVFGEDEDVHRDGGDWIDDVFDELNGRVVDEATRYRLEDLLETAMMEDGEERGFMDRIHADDLTNEGVTELFRQLIDRQPRTPRSTLTKPSWRGGFERFVESHIELANPALARNRADGPLGSPPFV